jgi:cell division protein FtsL
MEKVFLLTLVTKFFTLSMFAVSFKVSRCIIKERKILKTVKHKITVELKSLKGNTATTYRIKPPT